MANTYQLIASNTVSTPVASVTFSSIPATYTDLVLQVSVRSTEADTGTSLRVYFNSDTGNISVKELRAISTTVASYTVSYAQAGYIAGANSQANTFGSATIYIPNYTSSSNKSSLGDIAQVSNTGAENYGVLSARLWSVTDAITSVTVDDAAANWAQYSSFYLYGIKNS